MNLICWIKEAFDLNKNGYESRDTKNVFLKFLHSKTVKNVKFQICPIILSESSCTLYLITGC